MDYIDIHCHLDFPDYHTENEKDFIEVIERMKEKKVGAITIGTDLESSKRAVALAERIEKEFGWPYVWACIGVHPNESPSPSQGEGWSEVEPEFENLMSHSKVVAVGECGLDFFRTKPEDLAGEKERQTILFKQQIEFALKYNKPLMLHCRAAYEEALEILELYKKEAGEKLRGDAHFFAGSVEQAKRFTDLGFSCSFTGVVTFTHDYDAVVGSLPQHFIMSETDAPFATPAPYRGKRNEPVFVEEIALKLAALRGEELESFKKVLVHNAVNLFNLYAL